MQENNTFVRTKLQHAGAYLAMETNSEHIRRILDMRNNRIIRPVWASNQYTGVRIIDEPKITTRSDS